MNADMVVGSVSMVLGAAGLSWISMLCFRRGNLIGGMVFLGFMLMLLGAGIPGIRAKLAMAPREQAVEICPYCGRPTP